MVYFMLPYTSALLFFWVRTSSGVSKEREQWAKFTIHCFTPWLGNMTGTRGPGPSAALEECKRAEGGRMTLLLCLWCLQKLSQSTCWPHLHTDSVWATKDKPPKIWSQTGTDGVLLCPSPHCSHFARPQLELWLKFEAATNAINCILSSELGFLSTFSKHLWIIIVYHAPWLTLYRQR